QAGAEPTDSRACARMVLLPVVQVERNGAARSEDQPPLGSGERQEPRSSPAAEVHSSGHGRHTWTYCALRPEGRARSCKRSEALGCALEGSPDSYCAESKECAGSSAERLPKTTTAPSNEGCFVSSDQPRRLGQAASTVRATVEALNTTIGRPVSAIDICEALTNKERQTLAPRRSALRKRVARVLDELARRHILGKVKDGRTPVFFVPGILPEEACKQAAKPSRRRRVLSL